MRDVPASSRPELQVDKLVRRLVAAGVDFVVIGGIAAVLHGSARNTFDLDICLATDDANLAALSDVLVALDARLKGRTEDVPFVPDARMLRQVELLTMTTPLGEIDVLARPSGAPRYDSLRRRAERFELNGMRFLVASIDDLIAMKESANHPKDQADVAELQAIKRVRAREP